MNHNFLQMVDEQKRQKKLNNKDPLKDSKLLKKSQMGSNFQTNQNVTSRRATTAQRQSVISNVTNPDKQVVQSNIQMTTSGQNASLKGSGKDIKRAKSGLNDVVEKTQQRSKEISSVEIIQKFIRQKNFRRRIRNCEFDNDYFRNKNKLIHRQHVIDEIIMTESNYVRDLTTIISCIVSPLKEQGILTPLQVKQMFLTIDEIRGLNESILVMLMDCNKLMIEREQKTNLKQFYWRWFEELSHIIPFFKIYYQYCQGYEKSEKLRKQMRMENRAYADFLTLTRKTSAVMRGYDIEDLLIKPIQRLPKYVLLFKDLIKHTEKDHPDYLNIQSSLEQFEKINNENNQYIEEFIIFKKMAEINSMLISSHINKSVLKAKRRFIMEESLNLYTKVTKQYNPVVCYFLSDLVVVTERNMPLRESFPMKKSSQIDRLKNEVFTYKICKLLYLNHSSLIRLTPTPEFTTMFKITTEDETTFIAHDDEARDKCVKTVSSLIQDIKRIRLDKINFLNQTNYKYYVIEVQGTEENNYGTINSYTTYIIQISSKNIKQKIYLRFSEILETQQMIRKHFPDINIKPLSKMSWFLNHQTGTLKQRKREIEDFLQEIINMPEIQKKRSQILTLLGLPRSFFTQFTQEITSIQDRQSQQSITLDTNRSNRSTARDEFMIELKKEGTMKDSFIMNSMHADQLNTYGQIKTRFEDKLQDAKMLENIISADQMAVTIRVYLICGESLNITTNQSITAVQFSEIVATQLQLLHFHDFKLLIYPEEGNFRVIEDDQVLAKALPAVDDNIWVSSEEVTLKSKMLSFLKQRGRHSLVFRKYLTYSDQIERAQYQVDEVRLGLMTDHYFFCIKNMEYPLSFTEYAQFAVIWLYMVEGMDKYIMVTKKFPYDLLKKFIPREVYEKQTDEVWKQAIRSLFLHLDQQIQQIAILNQDQAEQESNQQIDFTNRNNLAMMVLINCIQLQPLFGAHVFYVGICRKYPPMVDKDVVMTKNMWLAISHQKIELYSPSKKVRFVEEQYEWITNLKSQEASIKFEIRGSTVKLLTNQSYMINSLMRDYKDIQKQ